MKKIFFLLSVVVLFSCNRKPFVAHKVKFEKVSGDCKDQQGYFRMISNFGGERYEFEKCLPADFNKEQVSSERKGDTVLVKFKEISQGQSTAAFHITLDIDSYPAYSFLIVDDDTYPIVVSQK